METSTLLLIGIAIVIIMFSSFSVAYTSEQSGVPGIITVGQAAPNTNLATHQTVAISGKIPEPEYAVYNLPAKDAYMTQAFKDQIDMLRARYYYFNDDLLSKYD
jgi:hypothetical protein